MDLDFIFFPAPKESVEIAFAEDTRILWIPKQAAFYPNFQNYIQRRNIKKIAFYVKKSTQQVEDEQLALIDDQQDFSKQPIPQFPYVHRQDNEYGGDMIKETTDSNSEVNSPDFEHSDYNSENLEFKLNLLNRQSISHIQQMKPSLPVVEIHRNKQREPTSRSSPHLSAVECDKDSIKQSRRSFRGKYNTIGYIPCLHLKYENSPFILLYFHANAEEITQSYHFLKHLHKFLQISIIAIEYPGYGKYKSEEPNAEAIQNDAEYVYNYLTKRIGYEEKNIIIFGRSIGSGPATYLASNHNPGCLILMSPFTSLKDAVRDFVKFAGSWLQHLIRQRFNNLENISNVTCPTFILHGKKDDMIPYKQAQQLRDKCGAEVCTLNLSDDMDHISYKLYADLLIPLMEFLIKINYYRYQKYSPKLPTNLYRNPNYLGND